jgi:hypothetical protein
MWEKLAHPALFVRKISDYYEIIQSLSYDGNIVSDIILWK